MRMKYIRFKHKGLNVIVQFQEIIAHKDMANGIRRHADHIDMGQGFNGPMVPVSSFIVSAGFVQCFDGKFHCFGESESLGIKSLPEDTEILQSQYSPY